MLLRAKLDKNILETTKRRKTNWIGHSWHRKCLLKQVIEGKVGGRIEMTGRRGRRRKQLLDYFREKGGCCTLKEEALDGTGWRNGFGKVCGPVVRQKRD